MAQSTQAFQGSARYATDLLPCGSAGTLPALLMGCDADPRSGVVNGGTPKETTSHVYNMERFQRDGAPSSVASLAGGATQRAPEDRLLGHMSLFGTVDNVLGAQSTHSSASASAAGNSTAGYGQKRA